MVKYKWTGSVSVDSKDFPASEASSSRRIPMILAHSHCSILMFLSKGSSTAEQVLSNSGGSENNSSVRTYVPTNDTIKTRILDDLFTFQSMFRYTEVIEYKNMIRCTVTHHFSLSEMFEIDSRERNLVFDNLDKPWNKSETCKKSQRESLIFRSNISHSDWGWSQKSFVDGKDDSAWTLPSSADSKSHQSIWIECPYVHSPLAIWSMAIA